MRNKIEEWYKVEGFDKLRVSNKGRIYKYYIQDKEWRIAPLSHNAYRYVQVGTIDSTEKQKTLIVSVLVAKACVHSPDPDNKIEVHHINEIRDDNRSENLQWVTHQENLVAGNRDKKSKQTMIDNESQNAPMKIALVRGDETKYFKSQGDAATFLGYKGPSAISSQLRRLKPLGKKMNGWVPYSVDENGNLYIPDSEPQFSTGKVFAEKDDTIIEAKNQREMASKLNTGISYLNLRIDTDNLIHGWKVYHEDPSHKVDHKYY